MTVLEPGPLACRCDGTGTVTYVVALPGSRTLIREHACPAGCPPATRPEPVRVDSMAAYLDAEERRLLKIGGLTVQCGPCQDFRTDVTDGVEHPCAHCQAESYAVWVAARESEMAR